MIGSSVTRGVMSTPFGVRTVTSTPSAISKLKRPSTVITRPDGICPPVTFAPLSSRSVASVMRGVATKMSALPSRSISYSPGRKVVKSTSRALEACSSIPSASPPIPRKFTDPFPTRLPPLRRTREISISSP
jgi:hypothetical protein